MKHVHNAEAFALARQVADAMFAVDTATKDTMQMQILVCEPGRAVLRMEVRPMHLNGHQICHGGFIFTLADSTFAFACNSYNVQTVAAGCSIEFLAPAFEGEQLQAEAVEQSRGGKTGVYDVVVTNPEGRKIALMRGKSHQLKGAVVD